MAKVNLHFEGIDPFSLDIGLINSWLHDCCLREGYELQALNIICCNDDFLLEINQAYLQHDYYTDIITFDLSESEKTIEGELYISIDRINENAQELSVSFEQELHRVIVHGTLHLLGYLDKTEQDQEIMRSKEDTYLSLLN